MIRDNVKRLLHELPHGVELEAAGKGRSLPEINEAIEAGIEIVGENYVQEAERMFEAIGDRVKWHFIGHLQKNKVKRAVRIFAMIETVDSYELAEEINKVCSGLGRVMPILVEINSGRERQKFGMMPDEVDGFVKEISRLKNIRVMGLMTMGPLVENPEGSRPYFAETKKIFERLKALDIAGVEMRYLSMGMSNSYKVAIEEGANLVRIGNKIFGEKTS